MTSSTSMTSVTSKVRNIGSLPQRRQSNPWHGLYALRHHGNMLVGGAAAAADDIKMMTFKQRPQVVKQALGRLCVAAIGVRQSGVRIKADTCAEAGQLLDERCHPGHVGHAVDADGKKPISCPSPREGRWICRGADDGL